MAVMRFDPFRDFDRLAEQVFSASPGSVRTPRFMPMDVYRHDDRFVLVVDLPGVATDSIDIDVDNDMLTIRAERAAPDGEGLDWIMSERYAGSYMRQLTLGEGVDTENISADYDAGVLTVTIPVAEKAKPRKIAVSGGGSSTAIETHAEDVTA
jgi:HSP20 family protein